MVRISLCGYIRGWGRVPHVYVPSKCYLLFSALLGKSSPDDGARQRVFIIICGSLLFIMALGEVDGGIVGQAGSPN